MQSKQPFQLKIQKASAENVKDIQVVLSTTWQATYSNLSSETIQQVKEKWHDTEFLTKQIENPKFYFPIALFEDKVVGIATSAENETGIVEVFRLYILPEYQGHGIGTELLEKVSEHYPHAELLRIYVEENNQSAIAFYEHKGFKKLRKEEETSFGEVMVDWVMEKQIAVD
ncbi:MAG TPA: GNAT family N-acetyltransferase [Patescibacteria group bacterium]